MNVNSVTALGQSAYLSYSTAAKNKTFSNTMTSSSNTDSYLFNSSSSSSGTNSYLFNSLSSSDSTDNDLWSSVFSDSSSTQSQILTTMKKYTSTSENFYSAFASSSSNLKAASTNLTSVLSNPDASTSDITNNIQTFVNDYNNTTALFNDNSSVSTTMSKFADFFTNGAKNANIPLANIGISVDDNGKMTVDESALTNAVQNNSSAIKNAFSGSQGLANQAYVKTAQAINNVENLVPFPDITNLTTGSSKLGLLADISA